MGLWQIICEQKWSLRSLDRAVEKTDLKKV